MKNIYDFKVIGAAAGGQTWTVFGEVTCEFNDVLSRITLECFERLTSDRAVFGKPGVGCNGPYQIERLEIGKRP